MRKGLHLPTNFGVQTADPAQAGLLWEAQQQKIWFEAPDGTELYIPNRTALIRSDNGNALSIVSDKYKPVQPADMINFYAKASEMAGAQIERLGCFNGGQYIWGMANMERDFRIMGQDQMQLALYFVTSYNGQTATRAFLSTVRVACANALALAFNGSEGAIHLPHNKEFALEDFTANLDGALGAWGTFEEQANEMARYKVTREEAVQMVLDTMYPDQSELDMDKVEKRISPIIEVINGGQGQDLVSTQGTLWGVLNGITRFVDHETRAANDDNRFRSAWIGEGAARKARAFEIAALKLAA